MTVEVPEPLAARLAVEAARRGIDPGDLAVETLQVALGDNARPPSPTSVAYGALRFRGPHLGTYRHVDRVLSTDVVQ